MPLQASHLKFALDLKDYFKPNDLGLYKEANKEIDSGK
jgi:hypothetical protein